MVSKKKGSVSAMSSVLTIIDSGKSCRSVAGEIGFGKTQIQGILRDREDILIRIGQEEPKHSRRAHVERDKREF